MGYRCPSCGFEHIDNAGGTLEEAVAAWNEIILRKQAEIEGVLPYPDKDR
jgi:transposase-like protein